MRPDTQRQTLTVEDFGRVIGIGRNGAYAAVQRGEVRAVKIGRRLLIPLAEVDRLLNGTTVSGEQQAEAR
jgi:excisionase family DNA binding protein